MPPRLSAPATLIPLPIEGAFSPHVVLVIKTVRLLKLTSTSNIKFNWEEADSYYVNIKYSNPHNAFISKAKLLKCSSSEWGLRYNICTCEILGGCNIHIQKIKQISQQATRPNLLHKFIAIVENLRYCTYLTSSFSCHERITVKSEASQNNYHQWIGE